MKWSLVIRQKENTNKIWFATEMMTCSNRDNAVFFVLLFWNEFLTRWMGFFLFAKMKKFDDFDNCFLSVGLFCRSPIFVFFYSRRICVYRFRFLCLYFAWKSSLTTYGLLIFYFSLWMKHASVSVYVYACVWMFWDDWNRLTWEKQFFWMTEKSQYIYNIFSDCVLFSLLGVFNLIVLLFVIMRYQKGGEKNETTFALSLAFTLYQFVKLIAIYEEKTEIVKNLGEKL